MLSDPGADALDFFLRCYDTFADRRLLKAVLAQLGRVASGSSCWLSLVYEDAFGKYILKSAQQTSFASLDPSIETSVFAKRLFLGILATRQYPAGFSSTGASDSRLANDQVIDFMLATSVTSPGVRRIEAASRMANFGDVLSLVLAMNPRLTAASSLQQQIDSGANAISSLVAMFTLLLDSNSPRHFPTSLEASIFNGQDHFGVSYGLQLALGEQGTRDGFPADRRDFIDAVEALGSKCIAESDHI